MTYSNDLKWRAVSLVYCYSLNVGEVSSILDVSERSITRWYNMFKKTGEIKKKKKGRPP